MFCSLNGNRVTSLTLVKPQRGCAFADVTLDAVVRFATPAVTLVLAGLTVTASVLRSGEFTGATEARIVAGHGGWSQEIPERFYQNPFGLKLSPILTDAANAVGESLIIDTDRTVGQFYVRERAVAARTLNQLTDGWWVQNDGVTRVGLRPTTTVSSQFDVTAASLGIGRVTIATDRPEDWEPGCFFSAPTITRRQVSAVIHRLNQSGLRTELWTS
jgi:hypothetical protein